MQNQIGLVVVLAVGLAACKGTATDPWVIRLVDIFPSALLQGTPVAQPSPEQTKWRFVEDEDLVWNVGAGVVDLRVQDNNLKGRSITTVPILHVERKSNFDDSDVLHKIVVRARVSHGESLGVKFSSGKSIDFDREVERANKFPWQLTTPLITGLEFQTYTISTAEAARTSYSASDLRHVLVRPTDVPDADFEIESVQLVFRKEHLASIPSGISWQGLSEIYRESIVARSPEEVRFNLNLPSKPILDLAFGMIEEVPITFRVDVETKGSRVQALLERTLTTPNRWQEVVLDLSELAGEEVILSFHLESEKQGAIGFWGSPAIRNRVSHAAAKSTPRGIVLVLFDTLRRDHLEAYGYDRQTAPTVAGMAQAGVLFKDAIAQGAWTKVSVPSILSSTYPTSNGIYELFHKLPASAVTLAESLRDAGYATWSGSANSFSGRANNLHQGFEVLHERSSLDVPGQQGRSKTARMLSDRLLPWLETHHDVPFFVFYHATDPHSPYEPYPPYDTQWAVPTGKIKYEEWMDKVKPLVRARQRNGRLPHEEDLMEVGVDPLDFNEVTLDWYDGSILGADVEFQKIVEKLRELGLEEDTLVIFFSDHGEEFFDHGGGFHEDNVYGELVNVPFLMRWPGVIPEGLVVEETVEMLDLAPTLLELVGIEVPERMQGNSLLPLLSLPDKAHRWVSQPAISEWTRRTDQQGRGVDVFSIILDGYKLIYNIGGPDDVPEFELYKHSADPLDQNEIASEHPDIVERLSKQLERWQKWAISEKLPTNAEEADGLDRDELERLRSLGYIQ